MTGVSLGNCNVNTYFFVVLDYNVEHGHVGYIYPSLGRNNTGPANVQIVIVVL